MEDHLPFVEDSFYTLAYDVFDYRVESGKKIHDLCTFFSQMFLFRRFGVASIDGSHHSATSHVSFLRRHCRRRWNGKMLQKCLINSPSLDCKIYSPAKMISCGRSLFVGGGLSERESCRVSLLTGTNFTPCRSFGSFLTHKYSQVEADIHLHFLFIFFTTMFYAWKASADR